jgi:hypothetical protein
MDNRNPFEVGEDPVRARRRIHAQGVNILRSLVEAYNTGILDDPKQAASLCTMFALVAEGKVKGKFDEASGSTKWNLEENYQQKLESVRDAILSTKVSTGPWNNSVDIHKK